MADNLKRQPKKGILKNSSSFETAERQREISKETKWDEMNIIATYHPKDKDYGHMKIEEPKTPYYANEDSGDELDGLDADLLASKIKSEGGDLPKAINQPQEESSSEEDEESPEERAKRKMFEAKRKQHYNEYYAVKLARKLMEQDDDEDDDEKKSKETDKEMEDVIEEKDEEMSHESKAQGNVDDAGGGK